MKTFAIVLGTIALAAVLVVAGFLAGSIWNQSRWGSAVMGTGMMGPNGMGPGTTGSSVQDVPCIEGQPGDGMMDYNWKDMPFGSAQEMPCGEAYTAPGGAKPSSLEEVETVVRDYVNRLGYTGMQVTEVMEFERNYYAIVAEQDSGVGAMELLVAKDSGVVSQEPGPNMMWNAKYGMMGRGGGMMGMLRPELGEGMDGYASGEMTLSAEEAEGVAQRWLDANLPGREAGDADEFYGYYTLHFLGDGRIEGMLSVHGSSGDVWYHSWHGDFVAMTEGHS